jgi:fatty-acyl-CoA synthase
MTEASPGTMILRPEDSVRKIGSAGVPHFFADVRVVRPDLTTADPEEPGEVVVQGPNVMKGYWRRPADTAATVADGWLHTGDAAMVDGDGYVYIVDRIKDMIISGGENVYPAEVENVLYEHPAVAECVVIGVPDERWGEVGRAVVVLHEGSDAQPDDILAFLTGRLAKYKIPRSVVTVDALPHNASGKIRRGDIRHTFGAQYEGAS